MHNAPTRFSGRSPTPPAFWRGRFDALESLLNRMNQ
jgi:hypothetical protein